MASEALGKDNVNIRRKTLISSLLHQRNGRRPMGDILEPDRRADRRGCGLDVPEAGLHVLPVRDSDPGWSGQQLRVSSSGRILLTGLQTITVESIPSFLLSVTIPGINSNLLDEVLNSLQFLVVGMLLLIVLLWRPEGLLREKPTYAIPKAQLKQMQAGIAGKPSEQRKGGT